jgi:hypothetical protein
MNEERHARHVFNQALRFCEYRLNLKPIEVRRIDFIGQVLAPLTDSIIHVSKNGIDI